MCKSGQIVGVFDAEAKYTGQHIRKLFCIGEEETTEKVKGSKVFEVWAEGKMLSIDPEALLGATIAYVNVKGTYAIIDIEGFPA